MPSSHSRSRTPPRIPDLSQSATQSAAAQSTEPRTANLSYEADGSASLLHDGKKRTLDLSAVHVAIQENNSGLIEKTRVRRYTFFIPHREKHKIAEVTMTFRYSTIKINLLVVAHTRTTSSSHPTNVKWHDLPKPGSTLTIPVTSCAAWLTVHPRSGIPLDLSKDIGDVIKDSKLLRTNMHACAKYPGIPQVAFVLNKLTGLEALESLLQRALSGWRWGKMPFISIHGVSSKATWTDESNTRHTQSSHATWYRPGNR